MKSQQKGYHYVTISSPQKQLHGSYVQTAYYDDDVIMVYC